MYSRELSDFSFHKEKDIAFGLSVNHEGLALVRVLEDGVEKVKPSAGVSTEVLVGFSTATLLLADQLVEIKEFTVPAVAPYTIDFGGVNLVTGQYRVESLILGAAANPGEFEVVPLSGVFTFNAAQAGLKVTITAKRTLTIEESRRVQGNREGFLHNARAFDVYGKIGVAQGKGIIYTDRYDVTADYSNVAGILKTAADGLITIGGAGAVLTAVCRVIAVPGLGQPFLGLEFNL